MLLGRGQVRISTLQWFADRSPGTAFTGSNWTNSLLNSPYAIQGIVYYYGSNGANCGTSCNAGSGLDLCLSCVNPAPPTGPYIDGANWIQPGAKRDVGGPCVHVEPDELIFSRGYRFKINYDVPQSVTKDLMSIAERNPQIEHRDIPEHLLEYEVR